MKLSGKTLLAGTLLATLPIAHAAEGPFEYSANVALTSDSVWRGYTQTDEGWATQGGFDINHETGIYVGAWGSNVKLLEGNTVKPKDRADLELDLYLGYAGELTHGLSYDIKAIRYMYPRAGSDLNYDFTEFHIGMGYALPQGTELGFSYDYSPEFTGKTDTAHHYVFNVGHSLPNGLGFGAYIGRQYLNKPKDYTYYGASISFSIADFEASINYSDTNLDNVKDKADSRVFFILSKTF
ncbi:MAG: hypothetical protein DRR16_20820 [Candidatus Parabeggiatoa sp. nov. 3]|nr:MAG: hypothetical protein DRR00_25040 [Gammaproteobacteria bacterium]RKZ60656.1 MAG: hypothetical protein DRQ99_21740 [Gammaproteobacteria bacterium]RKZ81986.1 MAG: hypothetical protein DRR16_20820 [Gammaproteobacteria bacterium]